MLVNLSMLEAFTELVVNTLRDPNTCLISNGLEAVLDENQLNYVNAGAFLMVLSSCVCWYAAPRRMVDVGVQNPRNPRDSENPTVCHHV